MTTARGYFGVAIGLGLIGLFSTGCADPNARQIEAQQLRINELSKQRDQLEGQLAAAMRDSEANRRRAEDLQRQLDAARMAGDGRQKGDFYEQGGIATATIAEDILFDSGKADLKSSGRAKLNDIARQIQASYSDRNIFVVGHTDNDPIKHTAKIWKDNLDLSLGRGRTVAMELMSHGIPSEHVVAAGQGEWNPLNANSSKESKKLNRRVEVIAVRRAQRPGESTEPAREPEAG